MNARSKEKQTEIFVFNLAFFNISMPHIQSREVLLFYLSLRNNAIICFLFYQTGLKFSLPFAARASYNKANRHEPVLKKQEQEKRNMKNTMAMKLICMLLCVVMLGAMLAGCASGKQETAQTQPAAADPAATSTPAAETDAPATEESPLTGTISIMSTKDSWYPGFDDVCEQIEKNYGIAVDLTLVDDSSMGEILGVKFSTGDAPDIFLQNAPQVVEQYDAPNNCVVLDNEPWVSRCTDADYLRYKGDGHIYAMPVYQPSSFFGGVYYNKEVMADCGITDPNPQTYQEFLDICQTVKDHGYTPIWMTDQDSWTTQVWTTVGWGVALDAKKDTIYDDLNTNKVDFQDVPEMVDVLQKLQDLYTAGYCNADHLSSPYASGQVAIGEKKAAMVIQGEWFVSACQAAYPDVQLGSFAIPFIDGADNKIAIGAFVLGGYVCKGENEELAKQFLNYWSQPEQMALIYAKNDVYPAFVDCEGNKIDPSIENLVENYVKTGRYTYEFDSYFDSARPIMTDYLFGNIVECVAGSKTPEQALTDWNIKFEQYMAEMEYDGF